ncbi:Na+/H+ antiporter NhaC family protein [Aquimarina sp. W85]|uniref:Na+/H+ antiporter NhaC family protein n=1 Tax=Aquimarina rhodophyticola TaxID=3342246 RepID=UPI0036725F6C
MIQPVHNVGSFKALLPLFIFVFTFLGVGIYQNDFYALPSPIAVFIGLLAAFLLFKQQTSLKIATFLKGCGDDKIMTMCIIYLLAGAFATVTKATGSVDDIVNLGLTYIAIEYIYLGIFIIASFLSISTGTSVGAIVALAPIVVSIADKSGVSLSILCGSLLGGAMFGDNLSIISDTTIAATQSLGCKMSDKFKQNIKIALPAAIITVAILFFQGLSITNTTVIAGESYSMLKITPYLLVIILSIIGVNVFIVLFFGILFTGVIGLLHQDFSILEFTKISYQGFTSMTEIFLLSMLTGGLAALVTLNGGINYILRKVANFITTKRSAQFGIAALVGTVNAAIANNTVSIIITGPIAKTINDEFKLDPRQSASILDIFACIIQGILPYGAQVLMILSFADGAIHYVDLLLNTWYLLLLFVLTISWIYFVKTSRR